jgi:hypothetical protein
MTLRHTLLRSRDSKSPETAWPVVVDAVRACHSNLRELLPIADVKSRDKRCRIKANFGKAKTY